MSKFLITLKRGKIFILLISTWVASSLAEETESLDDLAESLHDIGMSLDSQLIEQGLDLREHEEIVLNDNEIPGYQSYIDQLHQNNPVDDDSGFIMPNQDKLLELASLYRNQGTSALAESEVFKPLLTEEFMNSNFCDTYIPAMFRSMAGKIDFNNELGLIEKINNIMTHGLEDVNQIDEFLGADWALDSEPWDESQLIKDATDSPISTMIKSEKNAGIKPLGNVTDKEITSTTFNSVPLPPTPAPLPSGPTPSPPGSTPLPSAPVPLPSAPIPDWTKAFIGEENPSGRKIFSQTNCDRFASRGMNTGAWLKYEKHSEFTIRYKFCGEHALSLDRKEFVVTNKQATDKFYSMPDNTVVRLDECSEYTSNCAPMYVQMIAADILYERRIFDSEGYQLPGHWNVYIKEGRNEPRSSAFLNNINLTSPARARGGLRRLVFHEYFHAIQTMYGSEWAYLDNGFSTSQWGGRPLGFGKDSSWWSQLESLASWASMALKDRYPIYANENIIDDARNHLFKSVYHPLEYGFLAERYTSNGNTRPSLCLGCDTTKRYLETLRDDNLWNDSFPAIHNLLLKVTGRQVFHHSIAKFLQDYHLELLFSIMDRKWATSSPNFRFLNRRLPSTVIKSWPPRMQTVPNKMQAGFGECSNPDPLARVHANRVGSQYITGFTCDVKMSPTGAIYLNLPIDNNKLPDKIMIGGVGIKLHHDDIKRNFPRFGDKNFRTRPGELINGNLRVFAVPAKLTPKDTKQFSKTKALSLYVNPATKRNYTITTNNLSGMNHLYLVIDYPYMSYQWWRALSGRDPQKNNFMARVAVVAYWNS